MLSSWHSGQEVVLIVGILSVVVVKSSYYDVVFSHHVLNMLYAARLDIKKTGIFFNR